MNQLKSFLCTLIAGTLLVPAPAFADGHATDISGVFAFVSYDNPTKVTLILNVDPLLEPGSGPTYFPFDENVLYAIHVDNNNDGLDHVVFEINFQTEIRSPNIYATLEGAGSGIIAPANSPAPVAPGTPVVTPAITALDGPGSEGLSLRQHYTVTMVKAGVRTPLTNSMGGLLFAVPSNVGPRTMPNYPALAGQGIYGLGNGIRVFAGTTDDPSFADLGATFDTLNFRSGAGGGILSAAQDAFDAINISSDTLSGFNVNTIAIEVPIATLTRTGTMVAASNPAATIGVWGTTSLPRNRVLRAPLPAAYSGSFSQIQRMGNPLVRSMIIGTGSRDFWSMSQPKDDSQFNQFILDPRLARLLNAVYGITIPTPPRTDLTLLVQYVAPVAAPGTPAGPVADLLRLNTGVASTPMPNRRRLGVIAGDSAGYPNGRRVSDDVTDIILRAMAGVFVPTFNVAPNNSLGDGVNTNDVPYQETFPYVAFAQSGRNRRHIDPGEPGCTQGGGPACPVN